jgi:predicted Holliday junction resolvase-like endonuclease
MKKALMIVGIIAIIVITGVLVYYYIFFRTEIDRTEIRLKEQQAIEENLRQENLKQCLQDADDWKKDMINAAMDLSESTGKSISQDIFDRTQEEYNNKINQCKILYD